MGYFTLHGTEYLQLSIKIPSSDTYHISSVQPPEGLLILSHQKEGKIVRGEGLFNFAKSR